MKKFLCIVIDLKTRSDIKEYQVSANDKWKAESEVKAMYQVASHYTPRLPTIDNVIFDLVEI